MTLNFKTSEEGPTNSIVKSIKTSTIGVKKKKEMKKLKQKEKMQLEGGRERKGKFPVLSLSF